MYNGQQEQIPQLTITLNIDDNGREVYNWHLVGGFPTMDIVGSIIRAQTWLTVDDNNDKFTSMPEEYTEKHVALFMIWNSYTNRFDYYLDYATGKPTGLIGMLEMVKTVIVMTHMQQQALVQRQAQQSSILDPRTGKPFGA